MLPSSGVHDPQRRCWLSTQRTADGTARPSRWVADSRRRTLEQVVVAAQAPPLPREHAADHLLDPHRLFGAGHPRRNLYDDAVTGPVGGDGATRGACFERRLTTGCSSDHGTDRRRTRGELSRTHTPCTSVSAGRTRVARSSTATSTVVCNEHPQRHAALSPPHPHLHPQAACTDALTGVDAALPGSLVSLTTEPPLGSSGHSQGEGERPGRHGRGLRDVRRRLSGAAGRQAPRTGAIRMRRQRPVKFGRTTLAGGGEPFAQVVGGERHRLRERFVLQRLLEAAVPARAAPPW